jgi:macrolide transport system ATP-binding/permease protein
MRASEPVAGRFFTHAEAARRDKVAVLGATVARELFGGANPVGEAIRIERVNFTAIGVMPAKGGGGFRDFDDVVVVPVATAMYRLLGKRYLDSIDVEAADAGAMEDAKREVRASLARRRRIGGDLEKAVDIRDMTEIKETISQTSRTMSWLLGTIAAISLLVGGIGVMNIMLVSVTERTREIGLRKALGARRTDIMAQFLVESIVMTFCGGVLGVAAGVGSAAGLAGLAHWPIHVSGWSVALAAGFSVAVGLGFGLWPARKASGLDPIEALRYE